FAVEKSRIPQFFEAAGKGERGNNASNVMKTSLRIDGTLEVPNRDSSMASRYI
ncbi:2041_t:CDS:2, partial [Paraglomus brasilianum]